MHTRSNEHGSTHIALVSIVVIVIIGLLGFIFWKNFLDKPAPRQQTSTQTQTKSEKPTTNTELAIPEWSLSGYYDEKTLGSLTYTVEGESLTFSSPRVNELVPCEGIDGSSWKLLRITPEAMATMGVPLTPWTKIGDNYYERVYPQAGCESEAATISAVDKAYANLFATLKSR